MTEIDDLRAEAAGWRYRYFNTLRDLSEARAEVERLRAAMPGLPNVGPVTRHANGSLMLGGAFWAGEEGTAEGQRYDAAEHLAVAAFLDREAEERAATDTTKLRQSDFSPTESDWRRWDADTTTDPDQLRGELTALWEHMHEHKDHGHYTLAAILDRHFPEADDHRAGHRMNPLFDGN